MLTKKNDGSLSPSKKTSPMYSDHESEGSDRKIKLKPEASVKNPLLRSNSKLGLPKTPKHTSGLMAKMTKAIIA